jgi:hypothetical protein
VVPGAPTPLSRRNRHGKGIAGGAGRLPAWFLAALLAGAFVVGVAPLLLGPPGGDDAYYHAMRAHQHARCWRAGVLWPRWYPDLNGGLGGPEPRAYPALALAWHGALALALDDAVAATSLSTLLAPVVAALAMLVALRRRATPPGPAVAVAAAWSAAPYLLITLHPRAALAEAWGLAILPFGLGALLPPAPADRRHGVRAAAWLAALLAVHLLVAFMAIVIVGFAQLLGRRGRSLPWTLAAGGPGCCSPASRGCRASRCRAWRATCWSRATCDGTATCCPAVANDPVLGGHLTLALVAAAVAALAVALLGGGAARTPALAGIAAQGLCTPLAAPLYRVVPGFALLQFPWRWLGPATCLVLLAVASARGPLLRAVALGIVAAPLAVAPVWRGGCRRPPRGQRGGGGGRAAGARVPPILPSAPNFLPRGVSLAEALVAARRLRAELPTPEPAGPERWAYRLARSTAGEQVVPLLDGPGWRARVDGGEVGWSGARSLVAVPVPAGSHRVELRQVLLVEDVVGLLLSGAGVACLALLARRRHA